MIINRCLIANRGEIACRIIKTCNDMGIETVAIYSLVDKHQKHVLMADHAVCVGDAPSESSYCNVSNIIQAALSLQCDAIHPGYGFLSENAQFAKKVYEAGLLFVGPSFKVLEKCENKLLIKQQAKKLSIDTIEGFDDKVENLAQAKKAIETLQYPLMLKANNGEGGRHIYIVNHDKSLEELFNSLNNKSTSKPPTTFFIESYIKNSRHIEVQLLADQHNNIVPLGLRDCSIQENHRKIIEETEYSLQDDLKQTLINQAITLAKHLEMDNVCTVEFIVDEKMNYYFIEINPRIQVEHPVSEMTSNIDIVKTQLESTQGISLFTNNRDFSLSGHAIEARIYTKDYKQDTVDFFYVPEHDYVRVDSAIQDKGHVPLYYDGLIAKIIVVGNNRTQAIQRLVFILYQTILVGVLSNLEDLKAILSSKIFTQGKSTTQTMSIVVNSTLETTRKVQMHKPCCGYSVSQKTLEDNAYVCPYCHYHYPISAKKLVEILLEYPSIQEIDPFLQTNHHHHSKEYNQKLTHEKSNVNSEEAFLSVIGKIENIEVCLGVFEPAFLMGSLGSVVGEKITRLIEYATKHQLPLIIISASAGARMQEGLEALMQMAKTTLALTNFLKEGLFISICNNPTMGGTTASFAMLGDIILAQPQAHIGFSGKRVIEQTCKQSFDQSIQKAEVLHANSWIDGIVSRDTLKKSLLQLLKLHQHQRYIPYEYVPMVYKPSESSSTLKQVMTARKLDRLKTKQIIHDCFDAFYSLNDTNYISTSSLIIGLGLFRGFSVTVIAHHKDRALKQNGMLTPQDHLKIIKAVEQAEKFNRPIITFIDTPGADPSHSSEVNGQASAISKTLFAFSKASVPIINIILSEGGSGGALALGIGDVTLMLEHAYYSIISLEGYASILYKDASKISLAADNLKVSAQQCKEMNIVDEIIVEPSYQEVVTQIKGQINNHLNELLVLDTHTLLEKRYQKFRTIASASSDD